MLDKLWLILIIYITFLGIYFSKKISFKNYEIKSLIKKINKDSLFLALGTKMGVGTIIGTTMSIFIGGPGSLFWIYIFTFLTSGIIYVESFLGNKYKQKVENGYVGGIYYYTKYGIKKNKLAIFMQILFVSTYSFFFLMIQTNTVSSLLNVNKIVVFLIIAILVMLVITNDTKEITKLLNKMVPIMCTFFIIISLYGIIRNVHVLPLIFKSIIDSAFNYKTFLTGMIIGIKRSIFLNELLIGTTSMSSGINSEDAISTANTLILGSYFIVFVVSTLVSLLVLIYLNSSNIIVTSYLDLLKSTFTFHFASFGNYFLNIIVCLLAISTIISGIYIGISSFTYLFKNKRLITVFKIMMFVFITSGIFLDTTFIWKLIDTFMLILIVGNSFIITKLRGDI